MISSEVIYSRCMNYIGYLASNEMRGIGRRSS